MKKEWTAEELKRAGVPDLSMLDCSNYPMVMASSWDVSVSDKRASGERRQYHFPHIRPQSVLVACIGNLWEKDAWWHLQDMLLTTAVAGHSISLQEVYDPSIFSHDAIHMLRWQASMLARDSGIEWCLMVDNDVLVEKDTLLRLLAWDRPVVYPYLEDLEQRFPLSIAPMSAPELEPGHGLVPVRWAAMSCMLFNTRVFNVLDSNAWRGTDFLFGQALNYLGHRIYVDTDTVVKVVKGPARLASKSYDEFWQDHRHMRERLQAENRDRRPPPGFDPAKDNGWVDEYGTYFGVLNPSAEGPHTGNGNKGV